MDFLVDMLCYGSENILLWHIRWQRIEPFVDTRRCLIMEVSLLSEYARLHIIEVILLAFLPSWHVTLKLKLLCLEVIARVVFV